MYKFKPIKKSEKAAKYIREHGPMKLWPTNDICPKCGEKIEEEKVALDIDPVDNKMGNYHINCI